MWLPRFSSRVSVKGLRKFGLCFKQSNSARYLSTAKISYAIQRTAIDDKEQVVEVEWENHKVAKYPYIYLRDNCQCPLCYNNTTNTRTIDTVKTIDINISPENVTTNGNSIKCTWPDSHESIYDENWLKKRMFPESEADIQQSTYDDLIPVLWGSEFVSNIPTLDYDAVQSSDKHALDLISYLGTYGFCIVKKAPIREQVLRDIAHRVSLGYLRMHNYGEVLDVKVKKGPSNINFTSLPIAMHVDLPYYRYQPGIQFLHCIVQSEGDGSGVNQFSDAFNAAEEIRRKDSSTFDVLTKVKYRFRNAGTDVTGEYDIQHERPIIGLDIFGNVESVNINNYGRDSFINAPVGIVKKSYEAFYVLEQTLHNNLIEYKMEPGDIVCMNNRRIVHGRTGFDSSKTERWLQCCYFDWDETMSRYRTLKKNVACVLK